MPIQPQLRLAATLWSLAGHPSPRREWSLADKVAAIAAAGFEGVQAPYRLELIPLLRHHGLALIGAFDATAAEQFPAQINDFVTAGAVMANAQVGEHDTTPAAAVALILALMKAADAAGLRVQVETHRDTATETPEKLAKIVRGYRKIAGGSFPVTWDHSHFAVLKHLRATDFVTRLLDQPELVQRSRLFHCRPFNGHHCQVPVIGSGKKFTPEFNDWLVFARALLRQWRDGAAVQDERWVVPEMGGGNNGYQLSVFNSPWRAAMICARELRRVWNGLAEMEA